MRSEERLLRMVCALTVMVYVVLLVAAVRWHTG